MPRNRPAAARCASVALVALAVLTQGVVAHAADIVLRNAWMRPAPAGAESARVYVDVDSDVAVELVDVSTPVARKVEIVRTATIGAPATEKVVATYPVPAGATARLAYLGDHLRLVQLVRDAHNGEPVPLTLTFADGAGQRTDVPASVTVRGILMPQQVPQAPPGADSAAPSEPAPASSKM